jgi:hypothetical protein
VTWSQASTTTPALNAEDDFAITVGNNGSAGSLQTHLRITLPATITLLGPPSFERGSGCTGTQSIDCFLDVLPNGVSTIVRFATKVTGSGTQTLTATVTSDREADPSDNTAVETLQVATPTPPPPTPPPPTPPPAAKRHTIHGTAHADHIIGTAGPDLIDAGAGNDILFGGAGNDILFGGPGNDILFGDAGTDTIFGGAGHDTIRARDGQKDTIDCGPGRDVAFVDRVDRVVRCEVVHRR